jgi:hypothetical protein
MTEPTTGPLADKYNEPQLTRTAAAWLALDSEALGHLQAAGLSASYISNIRAGRARPNNDQQGRAIDALRLAQPETAERMARAYILDIVPADHLAQVTEILKTHPLISPTHTPDAPQDTTHALAIANLRRLALADPVAYEAIVLLSKHL